MRKESSNQFAEGLISDLNPINTPNTVLTDALNATIITYDGNEFSLQNDRGNYPLENCKLRENYIPVGLKEYGDILYIVSYNPITKNVEIGTYPSPAEVESSKNEDTDLELQSVIEQVDPNNEKGENYSKLVEKCQLHIWTSDNEEDSKLYPGDEYKIEEVDKSPYKYEALEYFIVDDNRQKHDINDLIKVGDEDFNAVPWQIPGWLAAQYRIGTFDDFIMSIKSIEAPTIRTDDPNEVITCTSHLNFQLRISDKLFLPKDNNDSVKTDLGIDLEFIKNGVLFDEETISLTEGEFIDWYADSKILWINYSKVLNELKFNDSVTIKATPCLRITVNGVTRKINYDSFTESYTLFLNSFGSYSDFNLANNIWKFYIDIDDLTNLYIEYDVEGPVITKTAVQLYYRVKDLNNNVLRNWSSVENYSGITSQGIGILPFDDFNSEKEFKKEGMYVLDFVFYKPTDNVSELNNQNIFSKLVIASQIFFDFVGEYSDFNQIGFDEWISKYDKSIISDAWQVFHGSESITDKMYQNYTWNEQGDLVKEGKVVFSDNTLNKLWNLNDESFDKGWVTSDEFKTISNQSVEFIAGVEGSEKISVQHKASALDGKLWKNTPQVNICIDSYISDSSIEIPISRTDLNAEKPINDQVIDVVYGKKKEFVYSKNSNEFTQIMNVRNIKKIPLMWMNNDMWFTAGNDKSKSVLKVGGFLEESSDYYFPEEKPTSFEETSITVNRNDVYRPNALTRALLSGLGDSDFGILGVLFNIGERKYRLYHGNTEIVNDKKTDQKLLFTYLVFKNTNDDNNNVVLIPFNNEPNDYWKRDLQNEADDFSDADWWHDGVIQIAQSVSGEIKDFISKIRICQSDDAIRKGHLIKIDSNGELENIPVCNISIKTDDFYKWMYDQYDLLNASHRWKLIDTIGNQACGNLLHGSINQINGHEFYSTLVEKGDNETSGSFAEINENIEKINSNIKLPELVNQTLLDKLLLRGNSTRGVYWLGEEKHTDLIELLNRNYMSSKIDQLTANSSNVVEMYTDVGNDHNKLYIAYVDNKLTAELP